jgi:hypothetical protein
MAPTAAYYPPRIVGITLRVMHIATLLFSVLVLLLFLKPSTTTTRTTTNPVEGSLHDADSFYAL